MERRERSEVRREGRCARQLEVVTGRARVIEKSTAREDSGLALLLVHCGPG